MVFCFSKPRPYGGGFALLYLKKNLSHGGLAFLINEKMCVNVSGGGLMCRYHPDLQAEVEQKTGYEKMVMRGREMDGYGYVNEAGITGEKNFSYWMKLCLDYNPLAAKSKKQTSTKRQSNKI